ncbi:MAG: DUF3108 domain-containing protein [Limnobacter sp.]|nr:DUF3108 domain-containing protein [Limnobacter sp.]
MKSLIVQGLASAALFLTSTGLHAQTTLKPCVGKSVLTNQTLTFALYHSKLPGQLATTEHQFRLSGSQFKIDSVSTAQGLLALFYSGELRQHSEGSIDGKLGLEPAYYSEQRGKKPLRETLVNAADKQVIFKKNGETAQWQRGTQDRLSMMYQLSSLLMCNNPKDDFFSVELPVMTTGRLETEVFRAEGTERLEMKESGQEIVALKLSNTPKEGDDVIRLWFDPNNAYTPVQIQVQEADGQSVTQTLIKRQTEPTE